jgi:hypothetical protein
VKRGTLNSSVEGLGAGLHSRKYIVRTTRLAMYLDDTIIGYKMPVLPGQPWNLHSEQLICGDEASVQAIFPAQVGHLMTELSIFFSVTGLDFQMPLSATMIWAEFQISSAWRMVERFC